MPPKNQPGPALPWYGKPLTIKPSDALIEHIEKYLQQHTDPSSAPQNGKELLFSALEAVLKGPQTTLADVQKLQEEAEKASETVRDAQSQIVNLKQLVSENDEKTNGLQQENDRLREENERLLEENRQETDRFTKLNEANEKLLELPELLLKKDNELSGLIFQINESEQIISQLREENQRITDEKARIEKERPLLGPSDAVISFNRDEKERLILARNVLLAIEHDLDSDAPKDVINAVVAEYLLLTANLVSISSVYGKAASLLPNP